MLNDIVNAWPYLCVLFSFILLAIASLRIYNLSLQQNIRALCLCIFIFFFGFRGYIGWDVHSYYPMFTACPQLWNLSAQTLQEEVREPGFLFYMSFLKSIWNNYHFYILVSTCIDALILNYFFKRYSFNYALCFVIFMAMLISFEIDLQRNIKSLLIFMLSIRYIEERRLVPFLILNLLGSTFHLTSLLFIPLYFLLYKALPLKGLILLFIITQVFYFLQIEYLKPLLTYTGILLNNTVGNLLIAYSNSGQFSWSKGISVGHLERALTFLMILLYYRKLLLAKPSNVIFINLFIIYACIQVFFVELSTLCNRLALLFAFSYLVVWPELFRCLRLRSNRLFALSFIFLYTILKVADYNSGIFFQYDNVLFGATSFEERHTIFYLNASELMNQQTP